MATIPLPALHAEAPQQPDPAGAIARIMQMKSLMQGQQLQQQQIQGAQLDNQQRQFAIQQQQAGIKAMQEWNGRNYEDLPDLMAKNGASLQTVMAAKSGIADYKQKIATLSKDQQQILKDNNDWAAGQIEALKLLPPDQQPQAFENLKAGYLSRPGVDPQQAQQIQSMQYQGPQQLNLLEKSLMGHSALIDQALKTAQTGEAQARADEAAAQTAKIKAETNPDNPIDPEFQKAKYQDILNRVNAKQRVSAQEYRWAQAYEFAQRKTSGTSDSLGIVTSNTSGPSGLAAARGNSGTSGASANGGNKENLVDAIGQYKMDPALMSRALYRHPELLGLLHEKYPDWDQTNYNAKNKMATYMTSGAGGKQLTAFNTAMQHLDVLDKLSDDLGNSNLQVYNRAANALRTQTGWAGVSNFAAAKNAMSGEVAAALKASGATDQEINHVGETFSAAQSPAQLHGAINTYRNLLGGKRDNLFRQYQNGMQGQPAFGSQVQNPQQTNGADPFAQFGGKAIK